jgi:hypothetical protein
MCCSLSFSIDHKDPNRGVRPHIAEASHPPEEVVIVVWCQNQVSMAKPHTCNSLHKHIKVLTGKVASEIWVKWFLLRHQDKISAAKVHGLNPKHAKYFNLATFDGCFDLLEKVMSTYNIQQHCKRVYIHLAAMW